MRDKSELRKSQQDIVTALYENDEKICVLRPGGGKTAGSLTAIQELKRDKVIRHALVTAPKRVARFVWPDEIAEWKHTCRLRYHVLVDGPRDRVPQLLAAPTRDVTIFGHDIIPWLLDQVKDLPDDHPIFDLLVIDEISRFRKPSGERYKAFVKQIDRWRMVWGLTGTLRPTSALDLFCPARLVTRAKLWGKSHDKWKRKHFYATDFEQHNWIPLPGEEEKINAEIASLIVTAEVPKESKPTIIFDHIELPEAARFEYDTMERKLFSVVDVDEDGNQKKVVAVNRAVSVGKLGQMANGFVYRGDGDDRVAYQLHDEKVEWLADLILNSTAPTILVYEYQQDFRLMQELIPGFRYLGAGNTEKQTAANIRDWNAGRLSFMGLHPASAGHGLNLQHGGADMAWMAPTWDSELWDQTIARLDRSGQMRQVMVRVCVANRTVDELKLNRVHYKLSEQEAFDRYVRRVGVKRAA